LEPCCHFGKTPPCTQAILAAGIRRVVVAQLDPFAQVAGRGVAELQAAGLDVTVGVLTADARRVNAPYLKLIQRQRPWIIAKWAMTLDGKIATQTGDSRWISNESSRAIVHALRGRVDAILVGRGTAAQDDPLLTARPAGPRTPLRIVVDTHASLAVESQLVRTARETPVLVAVGEESPTSNRQKLAEAGCEVLVCEGATHAARLDTLFKVLGQRKMTNVLVEGGGRLLGTLLDTRQIDEVHVFIAPKLIGGATASTPIAGIGIPAMSAALSLESPTLQQVDTDIYVRARVQPEAESAKIDR
jgi:diaminohydroxyphosphoribosylaminopyrimidine deaminase/5-amino-6-(5-phosphoribosylamino)uracil reductase